MPSPYLSHLSLASHMRQPAARSPQASHAPRSHAAHPCSMLHAPPARRASSLCPLPPLALSLRSSPPPPLPCAGRTSNHSASASASARATSLSRPCAPKAQAPRCAHHAPTHHAPRTTRPAARTTHFPPLPSRRPHLCEPLAYSCQSFVHPLLPNPTATAAHTLPVSGLPARPRSSARQVVPNTSLDRMAASSSRHGTCQNPPALRTTCAR